MILQASRGVQVLCAELPHRAAERAVGIEDPGRLSSNDSNDFEATQIIKI